MAKYGSKSVWLLVDGYNLISAKLQGLRHKIEVLQDASEGLGDSWPESTPTGSRKAEIAQEGAFFDTSAGNIHEALSASLPSSPQATMRVATLGFAGQTVGVPFTGAQAMFTLSYEPLSKLNALTRANAAYQVSGKLEGGVVLHPLGAETTGGNTQATSVDNTADPAQIVIPITSNSKANPTVVTCPVPHRLTTGDTVLIAGVSGSSPTINGIQAVTVLSTTTFSVPVDTSGAGSAGTGGTFTRAKTQAGAAGYLQWTNLTLGGATNAVVKVRHSADNNTFADLLTFTAATAARGAERVEVAGTVERYLAASHAFTGGGTPSFTYFAGLARF